MLSNKKLEKMMGLVLTIGTLLSAFVVLVGGSLFLAQNGQANAQTETLFNIPLEMNASYLWHSLSTFSPLGIIQVGLLLLVATQILRVGLLVWYYATIRDYTFLCICSFVLLIILGTFFYNFRI